MNSDNSQALNQLIESLKDKEKDKEIHEITYGSDAESQELEKEIQDLKKRISDMKGNVEKVEKLSIEEKLNRMSNIIIHLTE